MVLGPSPDAGPACRLLKAAIRAPSAGFSQGFSFLVLEGAEESAPFWQLIFEQAEHAGDTAMHRTVEAMSEAPLVIVPMASKDVYLSRTASSVLAGTAGIRSASGRTTGSARGATRSGLRKVS